MALAFQKPYASQSDVRLLLEERIDQALLDDIALGLPWIAREGLPPWPDPEDTIPWLPADDLAGQLLNQWPFPSQVPVQGERSR